MFRNYLKIALRNLGRHRAYTFINVVGLAAGMACCFFILLFVRDEFRYDRHHAHADRVYRIVSDWGGFSLPSTNPPFIRRFETDYPQITVGRLFRFGGLLRYEDRVHEEDNLLIANPQLFDVLSFEMQRGDAKAALAKPFTAIITPELARKYFGDEDPIGKKLILDTIGRFELEITGIVEPQPAASHFHYGLIGSWATLDALEFFNYEGGWGNNAIYTYLLLPEGSDSRQIEAQIPAFIERHAGMNWNGSEISLQALTDVHLHSQHNMELEPNGSAAYVYLFSLVGVFILVIACVNFMNLATARSEERAKEVGVRKVVGAQRRQLVQQFLAESLLLSMLGLALAVVLVVVALPAFRGLTGKPLAWSALADGPVVLGLVFVTLTVGLLAGSYPALFLSSFGPIAVLRGRFRVGSRGAVLRKGLVVFQFATSVCLIIGTAVVYNQLRYLRAANLGFEQEQVVVIPASVQAVVDNFGALKSGLQQRPGVRAVSISSESLPGELLNASGVRIEGGPDGEDGFVPLTTVSVGHGFFDVLGVPMALGRPFALERPADSSGFIVNETAFRLLKEKLPRPAGSDEAVVGKQLRVSGEEGPLLGVVQDFNMSSLHEAIQPIIFFINPDWYGNILVRVAPGDMMETLAAIEDVWRQVNPEFPFDYTFADAAFDAQYRAEERMGHIFTVFAGLAVLIACLGLFGLASYTAERRKKEIGVRKVMGATVPGIVLLLTKDFVRLVLIAFVVAAPVAYFGMSRWLRDFAYRVELGPELFLLAGAVAVAIALLTVSYQAVRAATADPVNSLRYE